MDFLKDPIDFAHEILDTFNGNTAAALGSILDERHGSLKLCPDNYILRVMQIIRNAEFEPTGTVCSPEKAAAQERWLAHEREDTLDLY